MWISASEHPNLLFSARTFEPAPVNARFRTGRPRFSGSGRACRRPVGQEKPGVTRQDRPVRGASDPGRKRGRCTLFRRLGRRGGTLGQASLRLHAEKLAPPHDRGELHRLFRRQLQRRLVHPRDSRRAARAVVQARHHEQRCQHEKYAKRYDKAPADTVARQVRTRILSGGNVGCPRSARNCAAVGAVPLSRIAAVGRGRERNLEAARPRRPPRPNGFGLSPGVKINHPACKISPGWSRAIQRRNVRENWDE